MRKVNLFGAALLALTTGAWSSGALAQTSDSSATPPADSSTPAPADSGSTGDASAKPMKKMSHHHAGKMHHGKMSKDSSKGDAAVDDLNAQSLDAAKSGKSFTPPTTTPAASMDKGMKSSKPMKHMHHKMMKKSAPAAGDTSAPASGDTSSTPPADSSGK